MCTAPCSSFAGECSTIRTCPPSSLPWERMCNASCHANRAQLEPKALASQTGPPMGQDRCAWVHVSPNVNMAETVFPQSVRSGLVRRAKNGRCFDTGCKNYLLIHLEVNARCWAQRAFLVLKQAPHITCCESILSHVETVA